MCLRPRFLITLCAPPWSCSESDPGKRGKGRGINALPAALAPQLNGYCANANTSAATKSTNPVAARALDITSSEVPENAYANMFR